MVRLSIVGIAVFSMLVAAPQARAAVIVLDFDTLITGSPPNGAPPIATLTISDVSSDVVNIRLDHNAGSAAGQFITGLWLNIDPLPGTLVQQNQTPAGKFDGSLTYGLNTEQRAGLKFDAAQQFETSNSGGGVNRLKPGEFVSFDLSGTGLSADDFLSTAVPSGGQRDDVIAMIHVQGIDGGVSGHLGVVPEPASIAALALGAGALLRRRRRN